MDESTWTAESERRNISRSIASIISYFGILIILLWMMGLPLLWLEEWPGRLTRPNSGVGFLIAGIALALSQPEKLNWSWRIPRLRFTVRSGGIVRLLGSLLIALGAISLSEHFINTPWQIDSALIFQSWYREVYAVESRMTAPAAIEFLLMGLSFVLIDRKVMKKIYLWEIISLAVLAISLDSFISFLYMNDTVPDFRTDEPLPIVSSIAFIIFSIGMLALRKDRGFVSTWVSDYGGSAMVRRWLPISILIFILTGEIVDIIQDYHLVRPGIALAIFIIFVISFTSIVVFISSVRLNENEKKLVHSNQLYAVLSQSNQTMVRTKEKRQLLQSVCGIMTKFGGFGASCVWMRNGDETILEPEAYSGRIADSMTDVSGFVSEFLKIESIGRVVKGDQPSAVIDVDADNMSALVKEAMLKARLRSSAVLPMKMFGKPAGVLIAWSGEKGFFSEGEMSLLSEVSLDLSFALEGLEREKMRENAETALRESEERFRATFEKAAVGVVLLTPTGIIMRTNPWFRQMTGYSESDLPGRSFLDLTYPADLHMDVSYLERALKGELSSYSIERRCVKKDGKPLWVHLSAALVRDRNSKPQNLIVVVQDISERKRTEDLLRKSREEYRSFFEEDITADFIATVEGRILSCNPAFVRIFGFESIEDAMNYNANDLFLNPSYRREFLELLQEVKKIENHEMTLRRKDGSEIYVIRNAFGVFDESGNLVQTKNYLFDDTRRKKLENQMLQTQKMESLGTLAGGIAHDFNNLLGIILGHASMMKRKDVGPERMERSLGAIELAAKRGTGLVSQLLTFARKENRVYESLNVNELIIDVQKLLEETFPKLVSIRVDLADDIPNIIGDPNQIHQALLNLCINGRDAMLDRKDGKSPGGTLSISTSVVSGEMIRNKYPKAGGYSYVRIMVVDTGVGMDEATRSRLFEPFFTTKERGKGTGLGLATVYGIVQDHEGTIEVSSEPGVGTSFTICLPSQSPAPRESTSGFSQTGLAEGGDETILVVENEDMIIDFLTEVLSRRGYKVITAVDGESAVAVYSERSGEIALVLSALGLPKLAGADLLSKLKHINPGVKVIFASGFLETEVAATISQSGASDFIQKPYSAAEVLRKVRDVLDAG